MKWSHLDGGRPESSGWTKSEWTDERIALLKKLWADGMSGSDIANRMGGVTRNAVIGKVHRLGLSGRAVTSQRRPSNVVRKGRRERLRQHGANLPDHRSFNGAGGHAGHTRRLSERRQAELALAAEIGMERATTQAGPDLIIPESERLYGLPNEGECKWLFGDGPFYRHKCQAVDGLPYCQFHANRAYRPPDYRPRLFNVAGGKATDTRELKEFDAMERA